MPLVPSLALVRDVPDVVIVEGWGSQRHELRDGVHDHNRAAGNRRWLYTAAVPIDDLTYL